MPSPSILNHNSRRAHRDAAKIPGMRSLHRGIHYHLNTDSVAKFMTTTRTKKRSDFRELLVHHQKINEELKDVYARTAALVKDNMTKEERQEASWKAFERIGGKRPKAPVKYAAHLQKVSMEKRRDRLRADEERTAAADTLDFNSGSATEKLRRKRVGNFVRGQLQRSAQLRRFGDPGHNLGASGHFDSRTNVLNLRGSVARKVSRAVEHDRRVGAVKTRRVGQRSMWDTPQYDVNNPDTRVIRDASADWRLGRAAGRRGSGLQRRNGTK